MTIMFLIRSLGVGGAERQLTNLAKGLQKLGHRITIVTFYSENLLEDELAAAGVSVRTLNKRGRWDIVNAAWRFLRLVKQERPVILHSYLSTGNLLALLPKIFYPSLKVVWGVRASNVDFSVYDWFSRICFQCECLLSGFADITISNSIVGREYHLRHGFPHNKMIVIHNGIDTELFRHDEAGRKRIRAEWRIRDEETLIGHVARLDPLKGHSTFIEAAALLVKAGNNIRIVCVGQGLSDYGEDGEGLRSLANQFGLANRVIWAGSRRDMAAVYNAFDVAVSSSRSEGFPNVIVEAMACGVPCVVTDVGDSAFIIETTGKLVSPDDPEVLARGIESVMKSRHKEQKAVLRQRIVQNFTSEKMVRATEALLSELARR